MALADGPPEESFAAVTGRRPVVFASRPVAADGARLVLIGHGRRVYLRRVDGLQIGLFAVHRHAVEVRFCYKSVSLNLLETIFCMYIQLCDWVLQTKTSYDIYTPQNSKNQCLVHI